MLHYVEKPSSFVSTTISCGTYLFSIELLSLLSTVFRGKHHLSGNEFAVEGDIPLDDVHSDSISLEKDVLGSLLDSKRVFVFHQKENFWWSPIKTPGSALYANRNYLALYRKLYTELLATSKPEGPRIIGDVYIHPTATIDPTATVSVLMLVLRQFNPCIAVLDWP